MLKSLVLVFHGVLLAAGSQLVGSHLLASQDSTQHQQAFVNQLGNRVQRFEKSTDEAGNVTGLVFINDEAFDKSVGAKPGIGDSELMAIGGLPELEAIFLEGQPVGDRGLQVLKHFPGMKRVGFHHMAKAEGATASPDFITVIDGMRELEIIEIKHNFKMQAINLEKLRGPFNKVWRLVLDAPVTPQQTLHLIRLCPNVTDLQLHRTDLTPEQLGEVAKLVPNLEVLWFMPRNELKSDHLAVLGKFKRLRIFSPQLFRNKLTYVDGWDGLLSVPSLERLEIAGDSATLNWKGIRQLRAARPDLVVDGRLTRSRNYNGL